MQELEAWVFLGQLGEESVRRLMATTGRGAGQQHNSTGREIGLTRIQGVPEGFVRGRPGKVKDIDGAEVELTDHSPGPAMQHLGELAVMLLIEGEDIGQSVANAAIRGQ